MNFLKSRNLIKKRGGKKAGAKMKSFLTESEGGFVPIDWETATQISLNLHAERKRKKKQ